MPKIRTTITPGEEIEVSLAEADYLESQGLVHHSRATTDEGARQSEIRQQLEAKSPKPGDVENDNADSDSDASNDNPENQER